MKSARLGIAGLGILLGLTFGGFEAKSQSLESQLKVIGGDLLSNSQNEFTRTIGKTLSTLGMMQYEIERAEAGSDKITIEQNNFPKEYLILSKDGKYFPAQGYEWINPSDVLDFRLRKMGSLESRASLAPFNMNQLTAEWNSIIKIKRPGSRSGRNTGIGTVFTCNWYRDLDGNGISFNEFNGIKKSFNKNEKIEIVGVYGTRLWDVKKKNFPVTSVVTFTLYRGEDGKFLGAEKKNNNYPFTKNTWLKRQTIIEAVTINPGNLNPGKYIYNIKLDFPNQSKKFNFPRAKSGEFEIIE